MPHAPTVRHRPVVLLLACAWLLLLSASALAMGKPSEESCKDLGKIEVKCYLCDTGEYLGTITMDAEYNPNTGDCMSAKQKAAKMCADNYTTEESHVDFSQIRLDYSYWLKGTRYHGGWSFLGRQCAE